MHMLRRNRAAVTTGLGFIIAVAGGLLAWRAYAGMTVPQGIAYSGELLNNGVPDNAMHNFTFELFDGVATVCIDGPRAIAVASGRFDVGDLFATNGCALDSILATKSTLFIRITVDGQVLAPPQPIGTVPFAVRARVAETAEASPPPGSIVAFGGSMAPSGWISCDGTAVSRTTYAALFAAIGTAWGTGDGTTTFNLPDLRPVTPQAQGGAPLVYSICVSGIYPVRQ